MSELFRDTTVATRRRKPLIAARGPAGAVLGVAVVLFAIMAAWVHDTRDPKGIDTAVLNWLTRDTDFVIKDSTLALTDPMLTVGTCATVVLIALMFRRWDLAALGVVGPLAGLALESWVLKPSINRLFGLTEELSKGTVKAGYAFPSGHETGVTSAVMLLVIVCLGSGWSRRAGIFVVSLGVVWVAIGSIALVRNGYHYFTDTLGGILLGVAVMIATALVIDVVAGRLSSPDGRDRSRTAPAA